MLSPLQAIQKVLVCAHALRRWAFINVLLEILDLSIWSVETKVFYFTNYLKVTYWFWSTIKWLSLQAFMDPMNFYSKIPLVISSDWSLILYRILINYWAISFCYCSRGSTLASYLGWFGVGAEDPKGFLDCWGKEALLSSWYMDRFSKKSCSILISTFIFIYLSIQIDGV